LDSVPAPSEQDVSGEESGPDEPLPKAAPAPKPAKSVLRKYIESFDQSTVQEMASLVSLEGAALVEMQTHALFGDLVALQRQMQVRTTCRRLKPHFTLARLAMTTVTGAKATIQHHDHQQEQQTG
jgi:hypothetical protein